MLKDELPDDLVEFLQSDRRLEYDAAACEIGVFTFRTLDAVAEIELAVRAAGQESTVDIAAVDLLKSCAGYDPRGMLVYIPSLRKYGWYDSEEESLITYRGMSWSDFLADPARYINAAWDLDTEIAEETFPDKAGDRIVEVYSTADSAEANGICDILEDKGIAAQIVGEGLGDAAGCLPLGQALAPWIWVREGDAGRAREIIEEWISKLRSDWSQPAERAEFVGDDAPSEAEEAELEPAEKDWGEEQEDEASIAGGGWFRWLGPVCAIAAVACILTGAVCAELNWLTIRKYPATATGALVDRSEQVHYYRPAPGSENLPLPHARSGLTVRYDSRYKFVVDDKTYYALVRDSYVHVPRLPIHYDPDQPEKNVGGELTPPWIIFAWTWGIGGLLACCGYGLGKAYPLGVRKHDV